MKPLTRIPIDKETYEHCKAFIDNNNIANRGRFDGNKTNQLVGTIGEVAFYKHLYKEFPKTKSGFDEGTDIIFEGASIDVKTMQRKVFMREDFVNNFIGLQKNYKTDVLVFLNYNTEVGEYGTIEICGWIFKLDLYKVANYYKAGTIRKRNDGTEFTLKEDLFEIPQTKLKYWND